jgi:hypothetical protein
MAIVPINRPRPDIKAAVPASSAPSNVPAGGTRTDIPDLPRRKRIAAGASTVTPAAARPSEAPSRSSETPRKVGRGHPPVEHQFKKGNKGGPGRPKGSKNHDTKLRERFEKTRLIKIDGIEKVASQHDILIDLRFKQALGGNEKAQHSLLGEGARLYPASDDDVSVGGVKALTRAEQVLFAEMLAEMNLPPMVPANLPQLQSSLDYPEEPEEAGEDDPSDEEHDA